MSIEEYDVANQVFLGTLPERENILLTDALGNVPPLRP